MNRNKPKILIIGTLPPPIGGVRIHVKRLIDILNAEKYPIRFIALSKLNLITLLFRIKSYKLLHLHTSNIYVQYYVSTLCKILKITCLITFHKDIYRYNDSAMKLVRLVLKRTTVPIVLNEGSMKLAKTINKNSQIISGFLPPGNEVGLPASVKAAICELRAKYLSIYATNASDMTFDTQGNEIYGILDLIEYFNQNEKDALIISDPSSKYNHLVQSNDIKINSNILIIVEDHSFFEVLKLSDACIRNTSTDGDSLSVKESLYLNKITFATNVVSRPKGVILYERGFYNFDIPKYYSKSRNEDLSGKKLLLELYDKYT